MTEVSTREQAAPRATALHRSGGLERVVRFVVRRLWSSRRCALSEVVAAQTKAYERSVLLVRLFYAGSLFLAIRSMGTWVAEMQVDAVNPQWPAKWLDSFGLGGGIKIILGGYLATAALAVMAPQWRSARIAYSFMLLQYMAFTNGFGKVNHNLHAWLFVSLVLILLPGRSRYRAKGVTDRNYFLTVIWLCQVVVLFFYTLTGLWKVGYALSALIQPRVSAFEFSGFSYIVADRLVGTSQDTIMGEFFVRNQLVGWVLFNATMYLEVTSLIIAFRPRLHRVWGFGLLLFHVGTYLAMGFTFLENTLLIGLLFLCSPVTPERVSPKEAFFDLPGIHFISKRIGRPKARVATWAAPSGRRR